LRGCEVGGFDEVEASAVVGAGSVGACATDGGWRVAVRHLGGAGVVGLRGFMANLLDERDIPTIPARRLYTGEHAGIFRRCRRSRRKPPQGRAQGLSRNDRGERRDTGPLMFSSCCVNLPVFSWACCREGGARCESGANALVQQSQKTPVRCGFYGGRLTDGGAISQSEDAASTGRR
jgi:hypothetical protein